MSGDELPVAPPASVVAPRARWREALVYLPLLLLVIVVVAAVRVRLPYYSIGPGSIRPTEPLIDLGGGTRDESPGSVAFATVVVNGRLTVVDIVVGWARPSVDIVPEDRVLQGRSPGANRRANQESMDSAKDLAVQVALQRLGQSRPAGAEVAIVVEGSPAVGVLGVGDVVVALDGQPVSGSGDLVGSIRRRTPGTVVTVAVVPGADGRRVTVGAGGAVDRQVVLGEGDPGVAFLGVSVRTAYDVDYPHTVVIDSGAVGGPSAGLAFTLGVLDLLTPGDLAGGREVAVTGTINPDGTVGAIGGVQQKAAAARAAGVQVMLVPASQTTEEIAQARALAGAGVEVVPVRTLDEALEQLGRHGGEVLRATVAAR